MILLVSGSTRMVRETAVLHPGRLGHLLTPRNGFRSSMLATGLPIAADNGAYTGLDVPRFRAMLAWLTCLPRGRCLWAVCPDVVGDAAATLALFDEWCAEVRTAAPVAFVVQNGQESLPVPWDGIDCLFLGGVPECPRCRLVCRAGHCPACGGAPAEWKLGHAAFVLAEGAKRRGKWLHMGRVNSMRRLRLASAWGCDSADGSSYSRFHHRTLTARPDMSLERHLRHLAAVEARRGTLFPDAEEATP